MFSLFAKNRSPSCTKGKKLGARRVAVAFIVTLALSIPTPGGLSAADQSSLWHALKSGRAVALLRHAIAPGTGDPANFTLGDCQTQRNLSDSGRDQAVRIGDRFRQNDIESAAVFSSQWCRCRETAQLLDLGPVTELPALNSFYQRYENRDRQTEALKLWIAGRADGRPTVLVTHQVNITALTGVFPRSGQLVVVERGVDGALTALGSIETD